MQYFLGFAFFLLWILLRSFRLLSKESAKETVIIVART